jgi:hypothetical protein
VAPAHIKKIEIFPAYVVLTKGEQSFPHGFKMEHYYQMRKKNLSLI